MTPNHEYAFYAGIGQRLREARERAGMTQDQVGAQVGVAGMTVCTWELARHRPSLFQYERLRKVLGL